MAVTHGSIAEINIPTGPQRTWLDPFRDLGISLTNWTIRYVPDTWVIALILSIIVFVMTLAWGGVGLGGAIAAWGKGMWALLTLMAEFSFTIMIAYVCAVAPIVARGLNWVASRSNPDKPWQAVLVMTVFSLITAWFNWAITIVISAALVPYLAKHNPKADYRMLVAAAYVGVATMWHSGISASGALIVATPDNFLFKAGILNELITVDRTIFTNINFLMIAVAAAVVILVMVLLTPRPDKAETLSRESAEEMIQVALVPRPDTMTVAQKLNWWPGWNVICGTGCLVWMIMSFSRSGLAAWTIDMYNLAFLTLALFLTWRPVVFLSACRKGVLGAWGILLQFPLYGGIFGLVSFTQLGHVLTNVFVSVATRETYLPIIYWYSGFLSYFVPSGGSKWAIEAPYLIPAAKAFDISPASITLVYGWGDMLTHLLQPFWAIALLDITKTSFGQIAGFCALLFVIYAIVMSAMMFFVPFGL
jgi:short-chain fatty acids transporter